jgi:hypothetical protein
VVRRVLLVIVAACGRIGFDPQGVPGDAVSGDGAPVGRCPGSTMAAFAPAVPYTTPDFLFRVAIVDVDRDGVLDLVATTGVVLSVGTYTLDVLRGNGDGTFQPAASVSAADGAQGVAVADLDRDDRPDAVVASSIVGAASVFLATGPGTFGPHVEYPVADASAVAIGDLDGDGVLDLAVCGASSNVVAVLAGKGDGTFAGAIEYPTGAAPADVRIADIDGDGRLDLVTADTTGAALSVLLNTGSGFAAPVDHAMLPEPYQLAIADLDGDDHLDLVSSDGNQTVSVLLGTGGGAFAPRRDYTFPAASSPVAVAIADVDGGGTLDIVVVLQNTGTVVVMNGDGAGSFVIGNSYGMFAQPGSVYVGDFDRDGRPDLAVLDIDIEILRNTCQ